MSCSICGRPLESKKSLCWYNYAGTMDQLCEGCVRALVEEFKTGSVIQNVFCSRCGIERACVRSRLSDWLLCGKCVDLLEEWLLGLETTGMPSEPAKLKFGLTVWRKALRVRCYFGTSVSEGEMVVEKRHAVMKRVGSHIPYHAFFVYLDGRLRGILNLQEADEYEAGTWDFQFANILKCDRVVAVDGADFREVLFEPI